MSGAAAAVGKIERAHEMYREGKHEAALGLYTEALAIAKTKPQKIALHSNRAACFLKLHDFKKAAEECTAVLELDHKHTGALMLRAQTLVTLKEYQSALFDVSRLMELNPSSEVYQNLQDRLKTQLSLAPIPESGEEEALTDESEEEEQAPLEDRLDDDEEEDIENTALETQTRKEDKKLETNAVHQKVQLPVIINEAPSAESLSSKNSSDLSSKGWEAIPKPKGHSKLDYSRWDEVADNSSEDDDDDDEEDSQPQYRFRVKTVGFQRVK